MSRVAFEVVLAGGIEAASALVAGVESLAAGLGVSPVSGDNCNLFDIVAPCLVADPFNLTPAEGEGPDAGGSGGGCEGID